MVASLCESALPQKLSRVPLGSMGLLYIYTNITRSRFNLGLGSNPTES